MTYFIIALVAALASLLTFFSGFGLGTLLLPAFGLFFPLEIAVALTGVVHFLNNIFKFGLVHSKTDWQVVKRFGLPSIVGALVGAFLLTQIQDNQSVLSYTLFGHGFSTTYLKLAMAVLMLFFALLEILPFLKKMEFSNLNLATGGVLSGFFGGFSGHQGALRSAFLIRYGLEKQTFIATGIVIACLVDISRLAVYSNRFLAAGLQHNLFLVVVATLAAFLGAYIGNHLLKKVTYQFVQTCVSVLLIVIAVAFGMGAI